MVLARYEKNHNIYRKYNGVLRSSLAPLGWALSIDQLRRDKDDNGMTTAMPTTAIIAATRNNPELSEWYGNRLEIR